MLKKKGFKPKKKKSGLLVVVKVTNGSKESRDVRCQKPRLSEKDGMMGSMFRLMSS